MHGLCLGAAVGQVAGARVRYLWTEGDEMRAGRVSDLLSSPLFAVDYKVEGSRGGEGVGRMGKMEAKEVRV